MQLHWLNTILPKNLSLHCQRIFQNRSPFLVLVNIYFIDLCSKTNIRYLSSSWNSIVGPNLNFNWAPLVYILRKDFWEIPSLGKRMNEKRTKKLRHIKEKCESLCRGYIWKTYYLGNIPENIVEGEYAILVYLLSLNSTLKTNSTAKH